MKLKSFIFTLCVLILCVNICSADTSNYFFKPTGKYSVGFQDYSWINKGICPDFNFNGKNQVDFSPNNKKHCHEIMARIYYPTITENHAGTPYYRPFIKATKDDLSTVPDITSEQVQQLDTIRSYSIEKSTIVIGKTFPVLIFSPGFGVQAQLYENIIIELVSHGYIVVAVNTIFINGDIELLNEHVVKAAMVNSRNEANRKFLPMQIQDLSYVFKQLHALHYTNSLFSAMDLKHIGAFGHSIGAKTVAKITLAHPDWFQAAATLDIASYEINEPIKELSIPFLHVISAYWESFFSWPLVFELGKNGYLVTLSPSEKNRYYSYHLNYTDFSTLQYLPVYKNYLDYVKNKQLAGKDIKLQSRKPLTQEIRRFNKSTYVLVKNNKTWNLSYYESGENARKIGIDMIAGLTMALNNLPKKNPEELTEIDIEPIEKAITSYHLGFGNFLGTGNGFQIIKSVNTYLLQFFDTFLKDKRNPAFKNCTVLSSDTILKCGPGDFGNPK